VAESRPRISKRLREAIRLMVEEGLTRAKAAELAGMTDHGLYSALRKPHVRSLRREILGNLRESAASRTIARAEKLADEAESEHVRNDANQWLASLDPATAPVQRSEVTHHGNLGPGLVIIMGSQAEPPAIEGRAVEIDPDRIPHPAELMACTGASAVPDPVLVKSGQADGE